MKFQGLLALMAGLLTATAHSQPTGEMAESRPRITRLAAVSSGSFHLQWEAPGVGVTGFRVYRDGQVVANLPANAHEFWDRGLAVATVYGYSVAALRGDTEIRSRPVSDTTRLPNEGTRARVEKFEIVVVGATPGGIAAALTAAR